MSLELITAGLQQVLGLDELKTQIADGRPLKVYWGTAPTGKIHIGYLVQLRKLVDCMRAGIAATVLIADHHAELGARSGIFRITEKTAYYETVLKSLIELLAPEFAGAVRFVRGSSFQTSPDYVKDLYRAARMITTTDAQKTGAGNAKSTGSVASALYPIMQMLDEEYLGADICCGGVDQLRIATFSRRMLPKLGYLPRIHLLTPMVTGIRGKPLAWTGEHCDAPGRFLPVRLPASRPKMSASDPISRIGVLDSPDEIRRAVNRAFCGRSVGVGDTFTYDPDDNSLIEMCQGLGLKNGFVTPGEHPAALKARIANEIIELLAPLRTDANLAAEAACEYRF